MGNNAPNNQPERIARNLRTMADDSSIADLARRVRAAFPRLDELRRDLERRAASTVLEHGEEVDGGALVRDLEERARKYGEARPAPYINGAGDVVLERGDNRTHAAAVRADLDELEFALERALAALPPRRAAALRELLGYRPRTRLGRIVERWRKFRVLVRLELERIKLQRDIERKLARARVVER